MKFCMQMIWFLISENMDDLKEKFYKWKEAFEAKGLKVNL